MTHTRVPNRLNVVTLGVDDLPGLRTFYERLGWVAHSQGDEWCRFDLGGATLALYPRHLLAGETGLPPAPAHAKATAVTFALCVERRDQVDAAIQRVREVGGIVLAEPIDRPWGGRSGYFADPEYNCWEIAWVPGSSFTEAGALVWPPIT